MSFLALHQHSFLEQRQSPEAGWGTGKSWSETYGRQRGAKHEDKNEHGNTEVNEHQIHTESVNVLLAPLSPRAEDGAGVVRRGACLGENTMSGMPHPRRQAWILNPFKYQVLATGQYSTLA